MPSGFKTQIIISDTSCLIALTNIGLLDVLRRLYETVLITPEVAGEYGELQKRQKPPGNPEWG